MHGSGEQKPAYVYQKEKTASLSITRNTDPKSPELILKSISDIIKTAQKNQYEDPFHASPTKVSPKRTRRGQYGASAPGTRDGTNQTVREEKAGQTNVNAISMASQESNMCRQESSTTNKDVERADATKPTEKETNRTTAPMEQQEETTAGHCSVLGNQGGINESKTENATESKKRNQSNKGELSNNDKNNKKQKLSKEAEKCVENDKREQENETKCSTGGNETRRRLFGRAQDNPSETQIVTQLDNVKAHGTREKEGATDQVVHPSNKGMAAVVLDSQVSQNGEGSPSTHVTPKKRDHSTVTKPPSSVQILSRPNSLRSKDSRMAHQIDHIYYKKEELESFWRLDGCQVHCEECCFDTHENRGKKSWKSSGYFVIFESRYYKDHLMKEGTWFDHNFTICFSLLMKHNHHSEETIVDTLPFGNEQQKDQFYSLQEKTKTICSIAHVNNNHYVFLDIDLMNKTITIDDGLSNGNEISQNKRCLNQIDSLLKRYSLSRGHYSVMTTKTVAQKDGHSCGPIACRNLWAKIDPENAPSPSKCSISQLREKVVKKAIDLISDGENYITTTQSATRRGKTFWTSSNKPFKTVWETVNESSNIPKRLRTDSVEDGAVQKCNEPSKAPPDHGPDKKGEVKGEKENAGSKPDSIISNEASRQDVTTALVTKTQALPDLVLGKQADPTRDSLTTTGNNNVNFEWRDYKVLLLGFVVRTIVHILHNSRGEEVSGQPTIVNNCSSFEHNLLLRAVSTKSFLMDLAGYCFDQTSRCNWSKSECGNDLREAIGRFRFLNSNMKDPIPSLGTLTSRLIYVNKDIRIPAIKQYNEKTNVKGNAKEKERAYGFGAVSKCSGASWLLCEKQSTDQKNEDSHFTNEDHLGVRDDDSQPQSRSSTDNNEPITGEQEEETKTDGRTMYSSLYGIQSLKEALSLKSSEFLPDYAYCDERLTNKIIKAIDGAIRRTREGNAFVPTDVKEQRVYTGLKSLKGSAVGNHQISCQAKTWTPPQLEGQPNEIKLSCGVIIISNVFASEKLQSIVRDIDELPVIRDNGYTNQPIKEKFRAHRSSSRNAGGVSQVTKNTLYATVSAIDDKWEGLLLDLAQEIMEIIQEVVQEFVKANYGKKRVPNLLGNNWTIDFVSGPLNGSLYHFHDDSAVGQNHSYDMTKYTELIACDRELVHILTKLPPLGWLVVLTYVLVHKPRGDESCKVTYRLKKTKFPNAKDASIEQLSFCTGDNDMHIQFFCLQDFTQHKVTNLLKGGDENDGSKIRCVHSLRWSLGGGGKDNWKVLLKRIEQKMNDAAYVNMQKEYTCAGAISCGQGRSDFKHLERDWFLDVADRFPKEEEVEKAHLRMSRFARQCETPSQYLHKLGYTTDHVKENRGNISHDRDRCVQFISKLNLDTNRYVRDGLCLWKFLSTYYCCQFLSERGVNLVLEYIEDGENTAGKRRSKKRYKERR